METEPTQNPTPASSDETVNTPGIQGEPGNANPAPSNMIPYERFKAVIDERNDIKNRLDALEREQNERAETEAKEQGRYKELYEAALGEIENLKRANETERLNTLRQSIGAKFNLPQRLIDRLVGNTAEELEADAQALADDLPAPKAPNIDSERTPASQVRTVTPEQFKKMSYKEQQQLFSDDPELFKRLLNS